MPLGLVWGKVGEGLVCFSVCGVSLYNWLMVVVMSYCDKFTYREFNLILEIAPFVFLVLFKDVGGRRVSPRFYLFISDINQRNEEAGRV